MLVSQQLVYTQLAYDNWPADIWSTDISSSVMFVAQIETGVMKKIVHKEKLDQCRQGILPK